MFLETRYHRSPSDFEADLDALEGLRTDVVNAVFVPEAVAKMIKYHAVLVQLGSKFPFDEENVPYQHLILITNDYGRSK